MARIQSFDELNKISSDTEYYRTYFKDMGLKDSQVEDRKDIALKLEDLMFFVFAIMLAMIESDSIDEVYASQQVYNRYIQILLDNGVAVDDEAERAARIFADSVVATTAKDTDGYGTSKRRAREVSASEANTIYNREDYLDAVASGRTMKQWITILDGKERPTHRVASGQTVSIDEPFAVGDSLLRFPHDQSLGASPEEIVNCRCSVRYY